ncbi:hypothetical protein CVT24_011661 [Panaeolus cyanescens]|uniref:G domain-containing protein n=1 Tax=Panaeolus cyanescens TaxID=181874 RepID=A0A409YH20_9AGAR|nr:hypothetical protein CVT24_011661 [Panaeolus cyanescens]
MGPTGSGKSSFIEAINSRSPRGPLGIAKNQLESVTKDVMGYCVRNVLHLRGPIIYIIDTPGFADPKMSELQVLGRLKGWRDDCNLGDTVCAIYFHPINDVRMASSKKKCMEALKSFWGLYNTPNITLVTTMWDNLRPEKRAAAEERFNNIAADTWGEWLGHGSKPIKFENTFESALSILNYVVRNGFSLKVESVPKAEGYGIAKPITGMPVAEELLRERINLLHQQCQVIDDDLRDPSNQENAELMQIFTKNRNIASELLEKFTSELEKYTLESALPAPPRSKSPRGYESGTRDVRLE